MGDPAREVMRGTLRTLRANIMRWNDAPYFYQKENYDYSPHKFRCPNGYRESFMQRCSTIEGFLRNDRSIWDIVIVPGHLANLQLYSARELHCMTYGFNEEFLIANTSRGRFYKGFIPTDDYGVHEEVIIKTWDFYVPPQQHYHDNPSRFCDELEMLTNEELHPSLMRLRGFCFKKTLAVVYDGRPSRLWSQVFPSDEIGWDDRMKVARQLAGLFVWLHGKRFYFGSFTLSGIMVDEAFDVQVFDYYHLSHVDGNAGSEAMKNDVHAFGVLLVELVANVREVDGPHYWWIQKQLQGGKRSIVDESLLRGDDERALAITELAARCVDRDPEARPDMRVVLHRLVNLAREKTLQDKTSYFAELFVSLSMLNQLINI